VVLSKQKATKSSKGKKVVKYDGGKKSGEDDDDEEKNLVLYIGHLPKDFAEIDLRRFLSQFGKVYNCRVARKIETGQPKGFAFVRFGDDETAKIVCETLHGYFLEKQRLVCQLRPSHPGMFFDTEKNMEKRKKKIQIEKKQRNQNLANSEKLKAITSRLVTREMKKRERLEALGIDYDFPGYKSNRADFEGEFVPEEEKDRPEDDGVENDGVAKKKKRRKDSMDSVNSEGSSTKEKKKKKKKRKDSIDSIASNSKKEEDEAHDTAAKKKKEKKKKNRKRSNSAT
jgi:nucleolar protein 15